MMNKKIISTIFLLLPLYSFADYNGIGIKVGLGYHDAISLPVEKDRGWTTAFNIVYEYNKHHFLLQSGVGLHYDYLNERLHPCQSFFPNMVDEDGDLCKYGYVFNDRQDNAHTLALDIPILVGGKWDLFYCLIGGTIQYSIKSQFNEKATLTTWGEYQNLIDCLEHMPNHNYFDNVGLSANQQFALPLAIRASAEIGIDLSSLLPYRPKTQSTIISRIAIFSECTINNLLPRLENNLYDFHLTGNQIPQFQISDITMQHSYKAKDSNITALRFWEIGVRYTLLFAAPIKTQACHCTRN